MVTILYLWFGSKDFHIDILDILVIWQKIRCVSDPRHAAAAFKAIAGK